MNKREKHIITPIARTTFWLNLIIWLHLGGSLYAFWVSDYIFCSFKSVFWYLIVCNTYRKTLCSIHEEKKLMVILTLWLCYIHAIIPLKSNVIEMARITFLSMVQFYNRSDILLELYTQREIILKINTLHNNFGTMRVLCKN